ncbi:MAG: hypothetical protein AAF830_14135 [Pseudomonadota bacterium]
MRWCAGGFFVLVGCGVELGDARFEVDECRTVALVDAETGALVVGAEDLAFPPTFTDTFYVSAYDRLKDEPGGIYRLPFPLTEHSEISATNLMPDARPHGIFVGFSSDLGAIVRVDGEPHYTQGTFNASVELTDDYVMHRHYGSVDWSEPFPLGCGANDVEADAYGFVGGPFSVAVTFDAQQCQPSLFSRAFSKGTGSVARFNIDDGSRTVVKSGLALSNGIAEYGLDTWVAEMRGRRVTALGRERSIDLPGAPDNLNASEEGIVAALQPSLWRFGLYRYGYAERAPTRIVLVDPETEEIELLFEDPNGRLLSGATAAVLRDDMLIASSVRGEALLVCENNG